MIIIGIGDVYYIRRWAINDSPDSCGIDGQESHDLSLSNSATSKSVGSRINAWILLSLTNAVTSSPTDSIEKFSVTTIELSITFRLLGNTVGLDTKQLEAVADLLKMLEVMT